MEGFKALAVISAPHATLTYRMSETLIDLDAIAARGSDGACLISVRLIYFACCA